MNPAPRNGDVKLFAVDGGERLGGSDQEKIVHRFALGSL